jgi:hypothetical protein
MILLVIRFGCKQALVQTINVKWNNILIRRSGEAISANLLTTYYFKMKGSSSKAAVTVSNRARGNMRPKIRGQLGANTILTGNELMEPLVQGATATLGARFYPLIAGNTEGRAITVFSNTARNFQKFLYEPGTTLHYQPAVGLNTAGTVYVAYIDNPEFISTYYSLAAAQRISAIKTVANVKAFPVWQDFTLPISGTPRQKRFSNDVTVTFRNRCCQGCFIVGVEGLDLQETGTTTSKTIGTVYLSQRLRLEQLSSYAD